MFLGEKGKDRSEKGRELKENIQFTKEFWENYSKILFLDCLVTRDTDRLRTTIYGKLTHAYRLLTLMQTKLTFLFAVLRKYFMMSMIRNNVYNKSRL